MNQDINLLRAQTSAEDIARTIKQELIEMAKYQPVRFHDFVAANKQLHSTTVDPDDMDDATYEVWHASHFFLNVLGTIPKHQLQAKPKRVIA